MRTKKMLTTAAMCLGLLMGAQAHADLSPKDPQVQQSKNLAGQNLIKITSIPVFPWLSLGKTSCQQARTAIAQFSGVGIISSGDASTITGGEFMNVTNVPLRMEAFLFGEPGLRAASIHCDPSPKGRTASYVVWMVERGERDRFLTPLINRLTQRYHNYAVPLSFSDGRGESEDRYILFDLGRFVVEIALPQDQEKAYVTFASRSIYEQTRKQRGLWDLVGPYLIESIGQ